MKIEMNKPREGENVKFNVELDKLRNELYPQDPIILVRGDAEKIKQHLDKGLAIKSRKNGRLTFKRGNETFKATFKEVL